MADNEFSKLSPPFQAAYSAAAASQAELGRLARGPVVDEAMLSGIARDVDERRAQELAAQQAQQEAAEELRRVSELLAASADRERRMEARAEAAEDRREADRRIAWIGALSGVIGVLVAILALVISIA